MSAQKMKTSFGGFAGSSSHSLRPEAGFTLLEVLIALAILAIAAAVTLSLMTGSMANIRKVQQRTRSIEQAESVMELALLDSTIQQPTSYSGSLQDGTRWIVKVEDYEAPVKEPQAGTVANLPVKLMAYSVELTGPESKAPDCRLQTLKLVKTQQTTRLPQ
jgi:general secretion pathway protein I